MPMRPFITDQSAFDSDQVAIMSQAFTSVCTALSISSDQYRAREAIAARIIDLARLGVLDAKALCNRVLMEAETKL